MRFLVLLMLVVFSAAIAASWFRSRGLAARRSADPADYRNHLDMARLIERLMQNDFVRGVIPDDEQATARRVLREFYGDDPKELPR